MTKFIGRKRNVGIGKETVRGTAVPATYWTPVMEFKNDDKIKQVINESSTGVIEDANGADITMKMSEGELTGRINDTAFGLILLGSLGSEPLAPVVVGGETIVYDHTFAVLESAQHPTLTVAIEEPNATGASGLRYALGAIDSLEIAMELEKYATYTIAFRGNSNTTGTNTPSYSASEDIFLPQHGEVKFASNLAGLTGATAIPVKKVTLKIAKNLEDDQVIGDIQAVDRLNKQFAVEGTVELLYTDRTYINTDLLGDLAQAMRIRLANTSVTLGVSSNPELTIDMASVKLSEVAIDQANNDLVKQTLSFKAFYSLTDASMVTAVLRNLVATSY